MSSEMLEAGNLDVVLIAMCWVLGPCSKVYAGSHMKAPNGIHLPHLIQRWRSLWKGESAMLKGLIVHDLAPARKLVQLRTCE